MNKITFLPVGLKQSSAALFSPFQGSACKFLFGPGTDEEKKDQIEKALEANSELQIEVQFYKKNGEEQGWMDCRQKQGAPKNGWQMVQYLLDVFPYGLLYYSPQSIYFHGPVIPDLSLFDSIQFKLAVAKSTTS